MDRLRRTQSLRRVATVGALAALLVPAGTAEAAKKVKLPTITSVSPMSAKVGDTLLIKGHNFRVGKRKNSVGFKSDGRAVVFVKSDVSTSTRIYVKVPKSLTKVMNSTSGAATATRFHLRILAARFGKAFTTNRLSPKIAPAPPAAGGGTGTPTSTGTSTGTGGSTTPSVDTRGPEGDCDGDGIKNKDETDADNDLLPDSLENQIGTDSCNADSDGDGVPDGYEYQSALDLNEGIYQSPDGVTPYPGKRPYPNALDGTDAKTDYDGDGLSMKSEYDLWVYTWKVAKTDSYSLTPLSYSDGKQYSKSIPAGSYDKWNDFLSWTAANGYGIVTLQDRGWTGFTAGANSYSLLDTNRDGTVSAGEANPLDRDHNGMLADDERDEDADGLSNIAEISTRMNPGYWGACYAAEPTYPVSYGGTSPTDADTDGDGIRDGADDQDHDDVPNIMEQSRFAASGYQFDETDDRVKGTLTGGGMLCKPDPDLNPDVPKHADAYGMVNPFNPCEPDPQSRTCGRNYEFGTLPAPFAGPNWWALN